MSDRIILLLILITVCYINSDMVMKKLNCIEDLKSSGNIIKFIAYLGHMLALFATSILGVVQLISEITRG